MLPVVLYRGNITPLIKPFLDLEAAEVNIKMLILPEDAMKQSLDLQRTTGSNFAWLDRFVL